MTGHNENLKRKALHRRLNFLRIFGTSIGCGGGIGLIAMLASITHNPVIAPSFGATCVIAMVTADSAFAQPRSIVGGHLLCSLVGVLCSNYFGTSGISLVIAVMISTAVMQITRTLHPPAAADPIFFMTHESMTPQLLFLSVMGGSIMLVAFFYAFHKWISKKTYPAYWY